jgi:hypothetical protein
MPQRGGQRGAASHPRRRLIGRTGLVAGAHAAPHPVGELGQLRSGRRAVLPLEPVRVRLVAFQRRGRGATQRFARHRHPQRGFGGGVARQHLRGERQRAHRVPLAQRALGGPGQGVAESRAPRQPLGGEPVLERGGVGNAEAFEEIAAPQGRESRGVRRGQSGLGFVPVRS